MKKIILLLLTSILTFSIQAQLRLGAPFTDHMVLQRNSTTAIWGWARGGNAEVRISPSWTDEVYTGKSNGYAKWEVQVPTPEAGGPHEITINETLVIKDVWIGEVWLCSGQSNMDWSALHGFNNADEEVKQANHPQIRLFYVPKMGAASPQENCDGKWEVCTPESMESFSAVAYFFGRELQQQLGVPIGLIHSAWGGTSAEVWTPQEIFDRDTTLGVWKKTETANAYHPSTGATLYNAMIHPLVPYDIAGAIWYQGESNRRNPFVYRRLFPAMIESWREVWAKDFPFYYVQIAPFHYKEPMKAALVQEAQLMSLATKKTGMVVTNDIGNVNDIHPGNKQDVGKRLAYWALAKGYGKTIVYSGPIYQSMEKQLNQLVIHFQYDEGLHFKGDVAKEFYIAGDDRVFYPAVAKIENNRLVASHPKVNAPVALRYAFSDTAVGSLSNKAGLPASPFRTDDWKPVLSVVDIKVERNASSKKEASINLSTKEAVDEIRYTLDGSIPGPDSKIYRSPILIKKGTHIKARAVERQIYSEVISEKMIILNKATFAKVETKNAPNPRYLSTGKNALTDGQAGSYSFNDGVWQGYQKVDLDITIDLGQTISINKIGTHFLQDQGAWIFLPKQVEISISEDGQHFTKVHTQETALAKKETAEIQTITKKSINKKARYIKLFAKNVGTCPDWHPGAGGAAWLFVDEVIVE